METVEHPPGDYLFPDSEACRAAGSHLTDCDGDGYCNLCGSQDTEGVVLDSDPMAREIAIAKHFAAAPFSPTAPEPQPKLAWGLQPPAGKTVAWGARAIFEVTSVRTPRMARGKRYVDIKRVPSVDLLWDRQAAMGPEDERKLLERWVNKKGMKLLNKNLKGLGIEPSDDYQLVIRDSGYVLEANPRKSFGYLYICAYKE